MLSVLKFTKQSFERWGVKEKAGSCGAVVRKCRSKRLEKISAKEAVYLKNLQMHGAGTLMQTRQLFPLLRNLKHQVAKAL